MPGPHSSRKRTAHTAEMDDVAADICTPAKFRGSAHALSPIQYRAVSTPVATHGDAQGLLVDSPTSPHGNLAGRSRTNFEKVREFHEAFGVQVEEQPKLDAFERDRPLIRLRRDLIREEVQELEDALVSKDFDGTVDALADILYVVYGAGVSLGVDLDAAFDIVHRSNMSKLCKSEAEAMRTVKAYQEQWASGEGKYDSAAYRRADDGKHWVVYNQSSGKVLKSCAWIAPDFAPIGVPPAMGVASAGVGEVTPLIQRLATPASWSA
mmetsp:Transcript_6827/g.19138  ORF Transcript_6827/g.19138 Transcript_6827/m.19138 type:complete len:266 (-) Transcript_6827:61-858(-)